MSEATRTLLNDLAIAGGCAVLAGALVSCAAFDLVVRWGDRRSAKVAGGGRAQAPAAVTAAVAPSPGVDRGGDRSSSHPPPVTSSPEFDLAEAVDRLIGGHQP